jgi:hypothetical protein
MNARDLARDDDFVSHMLVECLGTVEPLSVHKMDASRKLPTWDPEVVLEIVQKVRCPFSCNRALLLVQSANLRCLFAYYQIICLTLILSSWLCQM